MRDQEKTEQKNVGNIVENQDYQNMTPDEFKKIVPELRHKSRHQYLK